MFNLSLQSYYEYRVRLERGCNSQLYTIYFSPKYHFLATLLKLTYALSHARYKAD